MTEETAKANKLLAAGEVTAVQSTLTSEKYAGPEWDIHKRMNAAAGALANGGGNSMEMQSAAIYLMATFYCFTGQPGWFPAVSMVCEQYPFRGQQQHFYVCSRRW